MLSSTKALSSLGVVAVMVVGGVAVAAVEAPADPEVAVDTTTTEAPPTSDEPTTTSDDTTTTEVPSTTSAPTTTAEPTTTAPTTTVAAPEPSEVNLHGQCTAFAGREQPGSSQAWLRLQERAGGDIDGFCAQVFAQGGGEDDGAEEPVEQELDAPSASAGGRPAHAGPPAHARGNGRGGR